MHTAEAIYQQSPKVVARRLVISCGSSADAIKTLVEGATSLFGKPTGLLAERLAAITEEIAAIRNTKNDAFKFIHRGKTRRGAAPNIRRFL